MWRALALVACVASSHSLPPGEPSGELEAACPPSRADAICACLRSPSPACFPSLLEEARHRLDAPDPAVAYFIRQRLVSLLVQGEPNLDAALARYFPRYPVSYFPLAHAKLPPRLSNGCATAPEQVLIFPGIIRTPQRREFAQQIAALQQQFPGASFQVVDVDTFTQPSTAAAQASSLMAADGPIHLVGYSQGALSALWLLATSPSLSSRVKSVVLMNPAARGSEVANLLMKPLSLFEIEDSTCRSLPSWAALPCQKIAGYTLSATARMLLEGAAKALGLSVQIPAGATAGEYFLARIRGLESVTTGAAADFWSRYGAQLPRTPTYLLFRSAIGETRDLPLSNAFFYEWLSRVDRTLPENDMQVRLADQTLGPPLDGQQILSPVAEGNHWQWEMLPHDVPDPLMPEEMASRMSQVALFLALFETLNELGRYCAP